MFSDNFEEEVNKNTSKQAAASEMEHAIRKHIKVNLQDDPEYYQKLWEKLEAIIKQHQNDYDRMVQELFGVREEAVRGRQQTEEGISLIAMPFYDIMIKLAFSGTQPDAAAVDTCKRVIRNIIELLERTIGIIGFWQKGDEIRKLKGDITDVLLLSNVPELENGSDAIAVEILNLARRRHDDLVKGNR